MISCGRLRAPKDHALLQMLLLKRNSVSPRHEKISPYLSLYFHLEDHFPCQIFCFYGGYVVYEKDGHGLIVSLNEFIAYEEQVFQICNDLILNGYDDWRLPTEIELNSIYENLALNKIAGLKSRNPISIYNGSLDVFIDNCFWFLKKEGSKKGSGEIRYKSFDLGKNYISYNGYGLLHDRYEFKIRPIRTF